MKMLVRMMELIIFPLAGRVKTNLLKGNHLEMDMHSSKRCEQYASGVLLLTFNPLSLPLVILDIMMIDMSEYLNIKFSR